MLTQPDYFIDPHAGRPRLEWTDRNWRIYFDGLKQIVRPIADPKIRKLPVTHSQLQNGESYKGETAYQNYCSYINDILTNIRLGNTDYCYYIYQISDLLRFEPELMTQLCTEDRLCPYFKVWLPKRRGLH